MDSTKRREEIDKALEFIQSSLPYPEPEGYQDFLTQLVLNLLDEGNASFKDNDWDQAVRDFSEGLNVAQYATAEEIRIPEALFESLYVSRATAYYNLRQYECGMQDCDSALEMSKESAKALYRKALCLKELGQHREAYNCTTECLLITRLDNQVNELAQELAVSLGLKKRKPYISTTKVETITAGAVRNENMGPQAAQASTSQSHGDFRSQGLYPIGGIAPVLPYSAPGPSAMLSSQLPEKPRVTPSDLETLEDNELMGDDLDSLLDCFPSELEPAKTQTQAAFLDPPTYDLTQKSACVPTVTPVLPAPTLQLPPAFFSSAVSQLNCLDTFSAVGGGDTPKALVLDTLDTISTTDGLDALDSFSSDPTGGAGSDVPNLGLSAALNTAALDSLDSLDDLLSSPSHVDARKDTDEPKAKQDAEGQCQDETLDESLDASLDYLDTLDSISGLEDHSTDFPKIGDNTLNPLDSLDSLDTLDSLPILGRDQAALPTVIVGGGGLDSLSDFSLPGDYSFNPPHSATIPVTQSAKCGPKMKSCKGPSALANPLSATHEFMQACSACYSREGKGINSFVHKPGLVHNCKKDVLLCRRKTEYSLEWTRVRPIPVRSSFYGPFVLCRELLNSGDLYLCKYGEQCTFAFNQLEIDVWTEERKGTLDRSFLFESDSVGLDPGLSVARLLQEHNSIFMFLCQLCYDNKPRIISKQSQENPTMCSNPYTRHMFEANKCMVYMVKTNTVNYSKIRPLDINCYLSLCRHAIRYGCQREDSCHFAHSIIEYKTWKLQRDTGIAPEQIVKESMKYCKKQEQNPNKQKVNKTSTFGGSGGFKPRGGGVSSRSLNLQVRFVCAQCWRDGLTSEPDKSLKYCTAKGRHLWTKERRVLLVKSLERNKWVQVRPPPYSKNYPAQYDICAHILEKKKCTYTGKCTFAHSQEERELWTYMKNNDLRDMQQIYDIWLTSHNRQSNGAMVNQSLPFAEEKYIAMPTDYAEPMSGFHCHLCGRNSNSERQWQQHISSDKHKDRVFSCEEEDETLTWNYRFPGPRFEMCPKLNSQCPEGASCDYAHSPEELQEWLERRDYLRRKLAKAREDMLIMPDESDFGNYNFLLQD
ncbi:zinc finger CCCH domain-containing protein 7B-like [Lampris incognitus]|uniref:zinc finger CCCH domain-containing protein 7B-like n=1 Tax=Lampris incognitus TaxID=2546036 RepID=UPI0024B4EA9D|nr:zinc finger CCCH domain-containing protein 7B-like [Lampris incognitus]